MVEFNPETQKVVRNNRLTYNVPENEKRTVDEQINISFAGADPTKTTEESYDVFGVKNSGNRTTYYDSQGNRLGSSSVWENEKGECSTSVETSDATYYDWDNNGTLDCQDTDSVNDKSVQKNKDNRSKHGVSLNFVKQASSDEKQYNTWQR